jgi:hypothetical protein
MQQRERSFPQEEDLQHHLKLHGHHKSKRISFQERYGPAVELAWHFQVHHTLAEEEFGIMRATKRKQY